MNNCVNWKENNMDFMIIPNEDDCSSIHSSQFPISATQNTNQEREEQEEDDHEVVGAFISDSYAQRGTAATTSTTNAISGNGDQSVDFEQHETRNDEGAGGESTHSSTVESARQTCSSHRLTGIQTSASSAEKVSRSSENGSVHHELQFASPSPSGEGFISPTKRLGQLSPKVASDKEDDISAGSRKGPTTSSRVTETKSQQASSEESQQSRPRKSTYFQYPGSHWFDSPSSSDRQSKESESPATSTGINETHSVSSETSIQHTPSYISANTASAWGLSLSYTTAERQTHSTEARQQPNRQLTSSQLDGFEKHLFSKDERILSLLREKNAECMAHLPWLNKIDLSTVSTSNSIASNAMNTSAAARLSSSARDTVSARSLASDTSISTISSNVTMQMSSSSLAVTSRSSRAKQQVSMALKKGKHGSKNSKIPIQEHPQACKGTRHTLSSQELTETPQPVGMLYEELNDLIKYPTKRKNNENSSGLHVKFDGEEVASSDCLTRSSTSNSRSRQKKNFTHADSNDSQSSSQPVMAANSSRLRLERQNNSEVPSKHRRVERLIAANSSIGSSQKSVEKQTMPSISEIRDAMENRKSFTSGHTQSSPSSTRRRNPDVNECANWHSDPIKLAILEASREPASTLFVDLVRKMWENDANGFYNSLIQILQEKWIGRRIRVYWKLLSQWFYGSIQDVHLSDQPGTTRESLKWNHTLESIVDKLEQSADNFGKSSLWIDIKYDDRDNELMPWTKRHVQISEGDYVWDTEEKGDASDSIGLGTQMACSGLIQLASEIDSSVSPNVDAERSTTPVINTLPLYECLADTPERRFSDCDSDLDSQKSGSTVRLS